MNKKENLAVTPKFRFPEFLSEPVWSKVNIGEFLEESRIKGSKGDTAKKLTVKLWGNGVFEKQETLKGSENTQYFRRKSGQFIYSKLDFLNQAFGIIPNHLDNYESTVDLPCFDVSGKLDVRFLLEYVQQKNFYKKYGEIADGGRKAKRIQVETLLGFPICLPELSEQQKIADCLTSLDDLIAAEYKKLEFLKAHKKGLMQKLFPVEGEIVPEWRFPEFRESGEWNKEEINSIGEIVTGKTPDTNDGSLWNGDIQFITPTDISEKKYQLKTQRTVVNHAKIKVLPKNSILFTCIASIGKMAMSVYPCITNQQINAVIPYNSYNNEYIYYALLKKTDLIKSTLANTTLPIINKTEFSKLTLTVPKHPEEQQKIVDCLSSLDIFLTSQAEKIEYLKSHKKGLIQGLFPSLEEVSK